MPEPAARMGDTTAHGGQIVTGSRQVLIGGRPAARMGDRHACPAYSGDTPHVGGPIQSGSPSVLIGGRPAARCGDLVQCNGPPSAVTSGDASVLIG